MRSSGETLRGFFNGEEEITKEGGGERGKP